MVLPLLASANRDETKFERPDEFLPDRERQAQHLAFGYGIHFCLGAQLARLEARLGLEALLSRVRDFRLPASETPWLPGLTIRGPATLPVELLPA